jgi:hypothetical protein
VSYPPIDTDLLIEALEDGSGEMTYVLDRATGQVLLISLAAMTLTEHEEALAQVESDPQRYVFIEPISSSQAYEIMSAFVEQLTRSDAKERLARALGRDRPFRRFKDALLELLSAGMTSEEILADYEDLEQADILAALVFATRLSQVKRMQPLTV